MSTKLLRELEIQEANALNMAQFFRDQIKKIDKVKKPADPKIIAARGKAERNSSKRYS